MNLDEACVYHNLHAGYFKAYIYYIKYIYTAFGVDFEQAFVQKLYLNVIFLK